MNTQHDGVGPVMGNRGDAPPRIVTMEWIFEVAFLMFIGAVATLTTTVDQTAHLARAMYIASTRAEVCHCR